MRRNWHSKVVLRCSNTMLRMRNKNGIESPLFRSLSLSSVLPFFLFSRSDTMLRMNLYLSFLTVLNGSNMIILVYAYKFSIIESCILVINEGLG